MKVTILHKCPVCNGHGWIGTAKPCPTCKGTGLLREPAEIVKGRRVK